MTFEEANKELQRRCNGLKNPNHILEVALQMQKEIFKSFGLLKICDQCKHYGKNLKGYNPTYCKVINKHIDEDNTCHDWKIKVVK